MEDSIFQNDPQTLVKLKEKIRKAIGSVDRCMLQRVFQNQIKRINFSLKVVLNLSIEHSIKNTFQNFNQHFFRHIIKFFWKFSPVSSTFYTVSINFT